MNRILELQRLFTEEGTQIVEPTGGDGGSGTTPSCNSNTCHSGYSLFCEEGL
jgi:hypothetical protein